jgi:hypothetical protein
VCTFAAPDVQAAAAAAVAPLTPSPGRMLLARYNYDCEGSTIPALCLLEGTPRELGSRCDADPQCGIMLYFPFGMDYSGGGPEWMPGCDAHAMLGLAPAWVRINVGPTIACSFDSASQLLQPLTPWQLKLPMLQPSWLGGRHACGPF